MTIAMIVGGLAGMWAGIGLWFVHRSGPRGFTADAMLVLLWPVHVAVHFFRRWR